MPAAPQVAPPRRTTSIYVLQTEERCYSSHPIIKKLSSISVYIYIYNIDIKEIE